MSEEVNKETVRRYYEAWNTGDPSAFENMFAPDYVYHSSARTVRPGSAAQFHAQALAGIRATMPDLEYEIVELFSAEADRVVTRETMTGTHRGDLHSPWGVIPPTGKKGTTTLIGIHRFVEGKIAEQWWETDWADMLAELGCIRIPPAS
jgi:steroid delta-isomerase-like uncharacterized protein